MIEKHEIELIESTKENTRHIAIINDEMGELRDEQKSTNKEISEIKIKVMEISTDLDWIKRFFWIVATASIGSLIIAVIQLIKN